MLKAGRPCTGTAERDGDELENRRGVGACHEPATTRRSILEAIRMGG